MAASCRAEGLRAHQIAIAPIHQAQMAIKHRWRSSTDGDQAQMAFKHRWRSSADRLAIAPIDLRPSLKRQLVAAAFVLAAAVLAAAVPGLALAGQPIPGLDMSDASQGLPRSADSGKPMILAPPAAPLGQRGTGRCVPALPCGTRLLGTIRRNGAVELQVPAWRW
jgi:hypothetical protein